MACWRRTVTQTSRRAFSRRINKMMVRMDSQNRMGKMRSRRIQRYRRMMKAAVSAHQMRRNLGSRKVLDSHLTSTRFRTETMLSQRPQAPESRWSRRHLAHLIYTNHRSHHSSPRTRKRPSSWLFSDKMKTPTSSRKSKKH